MVDADHGADWERPFGELLRAARRRAGLSQREISERAGVSVRAIRAIELGRVRRPRARVVRRLAGAVGLDPPDPPGGPGEPAGAALRGRQNDHRLQVGVLGPLRISRGDRLLVERPLKPRYLLGVLALQPGRVVHHEELIDMLWDEHPPASYRNLVHTYVARLRNMLEPARSRGGTAGVIVGVNGGYRLVLEDVELDLLRFDDLAGRAQEIREPEPGAALQQMEEALRCWRGPVLADLPGRLRHHPAAVAVRQRRLRTVLSHADLAVELGKYEQAIEHLQPVTDEEPLHEGLHARLMLALAGCGQQAAALATFTRMRDRLIEELGVEPGAQLRDAHVRVLNDDVPKAQPVQLGQAGPDPRPVPAQLPPDVPGFTGRAGYLEKLDDLAGGGMAAPVAITGMAGVGKTALAVHWAHRVARRFGDGQLYVDLGGYAAGPPLEPIDALAALLGGLGMPVGRIPVEPEQAAALYRSLLTGKRMLVVLDNARSAEQVRPLLPGHPGCAVIVTSRGRLTALVATHGAQPVGLDVLPPHEATALLTRMLGADRVAVERRSAEELARRCGRLPLALRIAAANLTSEPWRSLTSYVAALGSHDLLSELALEDDPVAAVRPAFDHSYRLLSAPARRMFRLLGPVPGADISVPAAAALAGVTTQRAERLMKELFSAHLVEPRGSGRFGLHDLLRPYATERTESEDTDGDREAAAQRLLTWYLHVADKAALFLYPLRLRLPVRPASTRPQIVKDPRQALEWLDAERTCLVAAVRHAAEHGPPHIAWLLADTLRGYFWLHRHKIDWLAVANAGLLAAIDAGDVRAQAAGQLSLCHANAAVGHYRQALDSGNSALDLARRAGWLDGQAEALNELGLAHWWMGDLHRAADDLTRSLALSQETGRQGGQASALLHLGVMRWHLGDLQQAADHESAALALYRRLGSRNGEDQALANLGLAYYHLGRLDEARECLTEALAVLEETGNRFVCTYALATLAAVHYEAFRFKEATVAAEEVLSRAGQVDFRYIEASVHSVLGAISLHRGDRRQALGHHRYALDLARGTGVRPPQVKALLGLAATYQEEGSLGEALEHARQALALAEQGYLRVPEGQAHAATAAVYHALGQPDRALQHADRALSLHLRTGHRLGAARTLRLIGEIVRDLEGRDRAIPYWSDALELFTAIGTPEADDLRALLSGE